MNVVLAFWRHPQQVTQEFAAMLRDAFSKNGCDVLMLDLGAPDLAETLTRLVARNHADLVFAITPEALSFKFNEKYLWQQINARFGVYFLDSPLYSAYKPLLRDMVDQIDIGRLGFFSPDHTHTKVYRNYLSAIGKPHPIHFLPFAARAGDMAGKPFAERQLDLVLFANADMELVGSHIRGSAAESFARYQSDAVLFERILAFIDQQCQRPIGNDILQDFLHSFGLDNAAFIAGNGLALFLEIDGYLKRQHRQRLIDSLVDVPLTLFGAHWDKYAARSSCWTLGGTVPYTRQFSLFEDARAVINIDPNWGGGMHDRAFNAMMAGAVAITPHNALSGFAYDHGHDALLYRQPQEISAALQQYREQLPAIAARGHATTYLFHTWDQRMAAVKRFAEGS